MTLRDGAAIAEPCRSETGVAPPDVGTVSASAGGAFVASVVEAIDTRSSAEYPDLRPACRGAATAPAQLATT